MKIKRFEIWLADLNPRIGTEPGKVRPVVIVQTDLLNNQHPSTLICPITSNVQRESEILRVHLKKGSAKLMQDCDVLIDQIRAIDNKRFVEKLGEVSKPAGNRIIENIKTVLDLG